MAGTGSEIIDLVTLDAFDPAGLAEPVATLRLDGDNAGSQAAGSTTIGDDTADDRIHVRSLPGTVALTLYGGAGSDHFEIFSQDTAGDSDNTVDAIAGTINISPTAGTGEDSRDEVVALDSDHLIVVDRADTSFDTVDFVHGATTATIDGLFDSGTGVDLTVNVNIDELTVVTTDGADALNLDFAVEFKHELDSIEIYAAGGQDQFHLCRGFSHSGNMPPSCWMVTSWQRTRLFRPTPGINNDTIDFSAFTTPRTVTLTGVGPTNVTLTAGTAFTVGQQLRPPERRCSTPWTTTPSITRRPGRTSSSSAGRTPTATPSRRTSSVNAATTVAEPDRRAQPSVRRCRCFSERECRAAGRHGQRHRPGCSGVCRLPTASANTGQTTFPTMNTTDDGLGGSNQTSADRDGV